LVRVLKWVVDRRYPVVLVVLLPAIAMSVDQFLPVSATTLINIILVVSFIVATLLHWKIHSSLRAATLTVLVMTPVALAIYATPGFLAGGAGGFMDVMTNVLAWIVSFMYAITFSVISSVAFALLRTLIARFKSGSESSSEPTEPTDFN
jgi:hypothetical protein